MNPKKTLITTLLLAAATISGFVIFYLSKPDVPKPKNQTIVAFGDSLVQGVGSTEGNDFVSVTSRKLGVPIINKGRSGDTTESALERIGEVLALDPGVVIVVLGGNDYLRRVPKETTFKNLEEIIKKFKDNGTIVVLFGTRGGALRDTYEEDYARLAKKSKVIYIGNILRGLLGNKELMSDQIHPNDAGYARISGRLVPILSDIIR